MNIHKILIIQTAFIGDVILATGLIEKIRQYYPQASIDFLLREGNEGVLKHHPYIHTVVTWHKRKGKYKHLLKLLGTIRSAKYDVVINLQRFASMGMLTVLSGARQTLGFQKNPLSPLFTKSVKHRIGNDVHEYMRNHQVIAHLTDNTPAKPVLYPTATDYQSIASLTGTPYVCIAPTSVWFTKQLPEQKWVELIQQIPDKYYIYLLGSPGDRTACDKIVKNAGRTAIKNLAGDLSLLASAALMKGAVINYVNDSAPMHLASAMNAPTCAVYCSTVPAFGFGPLAEESIVMEIDYDLYCRPCGLHGYKACPQKHFKCAKDIKTERLSALVVGKE